MGFGFCFLTTALLFTTTRDCFRYPQGSSHRDKYLIMKNRRKRLLAIADIINNNAVASQDEILSLLYERGFEITQATLSRDLKLLKTNKVPNSIGGYSYIIPPVPDTSQPDMPVTIHPSVISVDISGNLLVIKTRNGHASSVAYDLDMIHSPLILGTIPGADTLIAIIAENTPRRIVLDILDGFVPEDVLDKARHRFA